jgi:hypothetical protein
MCGSIGRDGINEFEDTRIQNRSPTRYLPEGCFFFCGFDVASNSNKTTGGPSSYRIIQTGIKHSVKSPYSRASYRHRVTISCFLRRHSSSHRGRKTSPDFCKVVDTAVDHERFRHPIRKYQSVGIGSLEAKSGCGVV